MSAINKKSESKRTTHEGAKASSINTKQELERSVMSCMLWEDGFYESGVDIAERIKSLIPKVSAKDVYTMAVNARNEQKLRHIPLLIAREMSRINSHKHLVSKLLPEIIQRPDELTEFLSIYWKEKKQPLSAQVKIGLSNAFKKFDEYSLAKYNRKKEIKLRDVMFLVHPKAKDEVQQEVWNRLAKDELKTPDTWEVEISAKGNNKESWERLLTENKLGAMALLRNLRNMLGVGVNKKMLIDSLGKANYSKILPFRFVSAAKAAPEIESEIDEVFLKNMREQTKVKGKTVIVIDVSGSMYHSNVSAKSDMNRALAASALGAIGREIYEDVVVYATAGNDYTRIHQTELVPNRHGMGLVDAIFNMCRPLGGGGIFLNQVCKFITEKEKDAVRTIIITDEQDCGVGNEDSPSKAKPLGNGYIINVNTNQNGIAYNQNWTHINGWSESVLKFINCLEFSPQ